jgi:tRNA(Leu) C34 or U34 (ribose-2'-O)-methylase TrmL
MRPEIRCLNLATAVGIVLYESIRQLGLRIDEGLTVNRTQG